MFAGKPLRQFGQGQFPIGLDPADHYVPEARQPTAPAGRPWRPGDSEPVRAWRCASRTAVAALTPNRRAAARRELPSAIAP